MQNGGRGGGGKVKSNAMFKSWLIIDTLMADEEIVEAVVADEYVEGEETRGKLAALAIVAILIIASLSIYFILNKEEEDPFVPNPLKAKIFVLSDNVNIGDEVTFDASNSTGDIISYKWDFDYGFDSSGDGNPRNDVDARGITEKHTYMVAGDYKVSLTVENSTGTSKDTMFIHVGYFAEFFGTVGSTDPWESFHFSLGEIGEPNTAKNFTAILTYPSGSLERNNITFYLYNNTNNLVVDTEADPRETGPEQTEIYFTAVFQEIAGWGSGDFNAEVRWIAPLSATAISFDLTIRVYY
jgi:hypothetical protein